MTHVLHRHLRRTPPVAVAGRGMFITDASGKEYLDACGGAAVSCLGHGHPDVLAAMHAQTDKLAYAHTSFFTTEVAEELADRLVRTAPAGTSHAYFVSGGSEAVEAALKMARQYFVEIGQPQRATFIARRQSYHGNTLGALAVGGNEWRRRQFGPLLIDVAHVAPCYPYREQRDDETAEAYGARLAAELDATMQRIGPDKVIAFVAETVGGATAGVLTPVPGYFKAVREVCDRHGCLLILDEVMCGMGRTGTLHACEQDGVAPDLLIDRQGPGRRLPADRRRAGPGADRRRDGAGQRLLPARPHLPRSPGRLRGGAGRAEGDRARRAARARPRARGWAHGPAPGAIGRPSACRRYARPRPVLRDRAGARPGDEGAVRPGGPAPRAGEAARRWPAAS